MSSDLLDRRPEVLTDQADPAQIFEALDAHDQLSPERASTLDHVLTHWINRQLTRTGDGQGLLLLDEVIYDAARRLDRETPEGERLAARWQGFRDLLEARRLAAGRSDGRHARSIKHANQVLSLLQRGGAMGQGALREELQISASRLSQVLAVMEEGGLVRRERQGRENVVSIVARPAMRPVRLLMAS